MVSARLSVACILVYPCRRWSHGSWSRIMASQHCLSEMTCEMQSAHRALVLQTCYAERVASCRKGAEAALRTTAVLCSLLGIPLISHLGLQLPVLARRHFTHLSFFSFLSFFLIFLHFSCLPLHIHRVVFILSRSVSVGLSISSYLLRHYYRPLDGTLYL